jgi:hypothetical protein
MSSLLALLVCWGIVLVINVIPAFMPPSWTIMAAVALTAHVPLLVLTVGGAAMSAFGRTGLALLSRSLGHWLPRTDRRNAQALARFVNRHRNWRDAIVFLYCLGPFPSNPLFIAAGIGRTSLLRVTLAFFFSRAIADSFWVWTARHLSEGIQGLFLEQFTDWKAIALQVLALAFVALLLRLPWAAWLGVQDDAATAAWSSREGGDEHPETPESRVES